MKQISKRLIVSTGDFTCIQNERSALLLTNHPNITKLYGTFQDENYLYMMIQYAVHGELSDYLPLSEEQTRFYAAELILALEYLHTQAFIIHRYGRGPLNLGSFVRDIKPENLFLLSNWHLLLGDFGCSILTTEESGRTRVDLWPLHY